MEWIEFVLGGLFWSVSFVGGYLFNYYFEIKKQRKMEEKAFAKERYNITKENYSKILANYLRISKFGGIGDPETVYEGYLTSTGVYLDGDDISINILKDYLADHGKTTEQLTADDYAGLYNISIEKMRDRLAELRSEYEKQ